MCDFIESSELIDELGLIIRTEPICPGVYLLSARNDDELLPRDYYAVMEESIISQAAKSYGRKVSGLFLYSLADDASGQWIVKYEIARYRVRKHLPLDEPLRTTALFAAQIHPEYFGAFPVPIYTPQGCTVRYWILDNGIYWIETDRCENVLAVCYPIWSTELSEWTEKLGEETVYDKGHGIETTLGYIFFPEQISCIPIYELMRTRSEWSGTLIDRPALMNAIWKVLPEYALLTNQQEQAGQNDFVFLLLRELGVDAEPNISPDHMILISPDANKDFLLFKREDIKIGVE